MRSLGSAQLKELRESNRIKRSAISRWADIPYNTLYCWESGKNHPPHYVTLLYRYYIEHRHGSNYAQAA